MVNETNSITNTKIHFECDVEKLKFDEDEENAIYRVVQESMTNSVRHVERIKLLNGTVEFDGSDGFTTNVVIPIRWGEEYD